MFYLSNLLDLSIRIAIYYVIVMPRHLISFFIFLTTELMLIKVVSQDILINVKFLVKIIYKRYTSSGSYINPY